MIHVIATIELRPDTRDAFLVEFRKVMPLVHVEAGCLSYGPTLDVPTGLAAQGPPRENVVTIVEQWESLEALRAHIQAPHLAAYRLRVKDFVVGTTLQVLAPA